MNKNKAADASLATVFNGLISAFCSNPIGVHVETGGPVETLSVTSSWKDYGRVIGKNAKMLIALRTLAAAIGGAQGREVLLEALPPDSAERSEKHLFNPSEDWGKPEAERLLSPLLAAMFPESVLDINDSHAVNMLIKIGIPRSTTFSVIKGGKNTDRVEDRTRGTVLVDAREIQSCLRTVFAAIGKNNGRIISLDMGNCD